MPLIHDASGLRATRRYSWYSFRIALVCSMLAAGAAESVILALCRWRSPASLRIYARMASADSAAWLDAAASQRLGSIQAATVPGAAAGVPGWAGDVPGALLPHVYELLGSLEAAEGPSAGALLERVGQHPEVDGTDFARGLAALNLDVAPTADDFDHDELAEPYRKRTPLLHMPSTRLLRIGAR